MDVNLADLADLPGETCAPAGCVSVRSSGPAVVNWNLESDMGLRWMDV